MRRYICLINKNVGYTLMFEIQGQFPFTYSELYIYTLFQLILFNIHKQAHIYECACMITYVYVLCVYIYKCVCYYVITYLKVLSNKDWLSLKWLDFSFIIILLLFIVYKKNINGKYLLVKMFIFIKQTKIN
jgi:hypothetical protein